MEDVKFLLNARFLRSGKFLASYVTDACTCAHRCSSIVRKFNQNLNTLDLVHRRLNDNPICRKCGTEEETSAHILCECEALASLWVRFLWTRRILGCWGWGPSGTLLKAQGSYNLEQCWGHRGPVSRRRCIGPRGVRTPFIILFYSSP